MQERTVNVGMMSTFDLHVLRNALAVYSDYKMKAGKAHGFNRGMKDRRYRFSLYCSIKAHCNGATA